MIVPSRARFLRQADPEPLVLSLPLFCDAYDLFQRLARSGSPSFFLESGQGAPTVARYSFLGGDPYLIFTGTERHYELRTPDRTTIHEGDAFTALSGLLRTSRLARAEGLPPFFGGAVGFLSYDTVRRFERLPRLAADDVGLPDMRFAFVDLVVAVDHLTETVHLIFAPPLARFLGESREKIYREGCDRLAELEVRLSASLPQAEMGVPLGRLAVSVDQSRDAYMERVRRCQEYIRAGDIYQANLSHRFTVDFAGQSIPRLVRQLYGRLRRVNPSPFSALVSFDDVTLISSSPERLVRVQGDRVDTRPIAGTRPRGRDLAKDRRLAEELLTNAKERAEHVMLVDLERNDVGRVCRYGTVRVDELMTIERYSHVSHIVSNITGRLQKGMDGFDAIRAVFPGGTITGVPKIRCMELIESLEPVRRGPYTGSLGYLSWSGDLDLNIIIRTLVVIHDRGFIQVGAGIVADSEPSREYDETLFKAEALLTALQEM